MLEFQRSDGGAAPDCGFEHSCRCVFELRPDGQTPRQPCYPHIQIIQKTLNVKGRSVPIDRWIQGQHRFAYVALPHPLDERVDCKVFGFNTFQRSNMPHQHVIDAADKTGGLQRQKVLGLFDNPYLRMIAILVGTDCTRIIFSEIVTNTAMENFVLHIKDRLGKFSGEIARFAQDVKGQTLGASWADSGQLLKLRLEAGQRFDRLAAHRRSPTAFDGVLAATEHLRQTGYVESAG